jgi:hypothetical protein
VFYYSTHRAYGHMTDAQFICTLLVVAAGVAFLVWLARKDRN